MSADPPEQHSGGTERNADARWSRASGPESPDPTAATLAFPEGEVAGLVEALCHLGAALERPAQVARIHAAIAESGRRALDAAGAVFFAPEPTGHSLRARAGVGILARLENELVPADAGFEGLALLRQEVRATDDLAAEADAFRPAERHLPNGPAVALPLTTPDATMGVLLVVRAAGDSAFSAVEVDRLRSLSPVMVAALRNVAEFDAARAAEEGLASWRRGRELAAWNDRLTTGAALLDAAVFEWSPPRDRIVWAPGLPAAFGAADELGSSLAALLARVDPSERELVRSALLAAPSREEPTEVPFHLTRPDGSVREVVLRAISSADGTRVVGALEDRTGRTGTRQVSDAIREAIRTLRHDLSNPLAIVLGYIQLLREDPALQDDIRLQQSLECIHNGALRIGDLVRQVTDAAEPPDEELVGEPPAVVRPAGWEVAEGFRIIVENLADGVVITDANRTVRYANHQVAGILGVPAGEIGGRDVCELIPPSANRGILLERFDRHLNGTSEMYEIRIPSREEGAPAWAEISGGPYRDAGGEIVGVLYTLTDVTSRRRSEHRMREVALQDPLTGLPNRTLLLERLQNAAARARRHKGHQFAVLFLDVDHLKQVNDSLGHPAGDILLATVARRLQMCLRPEDTVARFGGDEFAVLLEGIQGTADATRVALRIQEELAAPIDVGGYEASTSASIGIALSSPGADTVDQLLHNADAAMYRAKAQGRGGYEVFDREMHAQAMQRLKMEVELRTAVERNQLRLLYQPILSLESRRIVAVEALLRWEHPERGEIQPNDFLPLAEETRLILPIGKWVLREACRQMSEWRQRFGDRAPQWVAVNLSTKQLVQPGFAKQVRDIVEEAGIDPASLTLELTERMLSEHEQVATHMLIELTDFGIRINMDDFGTGYSSLQSLQRLPIDALKIDSSFVRRIDAEQMPGAPQEGPPAHLIRTILTVANGVGATTIAEGIDSVLQLAELERLGCPYGQGFLFARPVGAESLDALLQRETLSVNGGD